MKIEIVTFKETGKMNICEEVEIKGFADHQLIDALASKKSLTSFLKENTGKAVILYGEDQMRFLTEDYMLSILAYQNLEG
jgi:hypothetical protein